VQSLEPTNGEGLRVELAVTDDGPGIEPNEVPLLFDKYVQLSRSRGRAEDYKGTGLGLALCRRLIEKQGGSIAVDGRPGEGACFRVALPAG
jgi:two-component system phosphate regulon sensor histidine kinase PhoR